MKTPINPRVLGLARAILKKEGGWVDHRSDRGGATNHGISLRYARGKGLALDLDKDGDVDAADIQLITPDQAIQLYIEDFYLAPGFDRLPVEIQAQMFDMAVNHGPGGAVRVLQNALNSLKPPRAQALDIDGGLGPKTRAMIDTVLKWRSIRDLNNAVAAAREALMRRIVENDPSQAVFLNGWLRRARTFRMI